MADRADQLRFHYIQLIFAGDIAVDEQRTDTRLPAEDRYGVHIHVLKRILADGILH
ncbi:hypothetical protein D3C80_1911360 [compost metagenome]